MTDLDPQMNSSDDSWRAEVIQALRAMQDGRLDLVEGCRIVTKALTRMKWDVSTSGAAATIFGVESETDTFPIGPDRDQWDPAAIVRLDAELSEYLDTIRERLLAACNELAGELALQEPKIKAPLRRFAAVACADAGSSTGDDRATAGVTISDSDPRGVLTFDLRDILALVPPASGDSTWEVSHVEAVGTSAEALHEAADTGARLTDQRLRQIAAGITQTIDGELRAYRSGEREPWLVIRAVDSSSFDVISDDLVLIETLRAHFECVTAYPASEL